jgi:hypothetical protein
MEFFRPLNSNLCEVDFLPTRETFPNQETLEQRSPKTSEHTLTPPSLWASGLPDFVLVQQAKTEEYTKLPQNYQMALKHTKRA